MKGSTNTQASRALYVLLPRAARVEARKLDEFIVTAQRSGDDLALLRDEWQRLRGLPMSQLVSEARDDDATRIIKNIVRQKIIFQYDPDWIELFFDSTDQRLRGYQFVSMKELLRYLYGAGDVVGMMAAQLMGVPKGAHHATAMLARALLYLDIIASADRNEALFPSDEFEKYGLDNLGLVTTMRERGAFHEFIRAQLSLYNTWQKQALRGLERVPREARRVVLALIDVGHLRARALGATPERIYLSRPVPSRARIIALVATRLFD